MKTNVLLSFVLIAFIGLSSCDKIQEVASVKVDTAINIEVPLESAAVSIISTESNLKSVKADQPINGTGTFNLSSISAIEPYIDGINNFNITTGTATIKGLTGDEEITALNFKMKRQGVIVFEFSIPAPLSNGAPSFAIPNLANLSSALTTYKTETFDIEISGTSNKTFSSSVTYNADFNGEVSYFPL